MIGYTPLLRKGDLTLNAVLFRQKILGPRSLGSSIREIRGGTGTWRLNLFGEDAEAIAHLVYGDKSLAAKIAKENTLLGLYFCCMSSSEEMKVGAQTMSRYVQNHLVSSHLRFCRECVSEDINDRGYAAWRVLHQVKNIDCCPLHSIRLVKSPHLATTRPRDLHSKFPSDFPFVSEPSAGMEIPVSDGYANYLKLWHLAFFWVLPNIKIDRWSHCVGAAAEKVGNQCGLEKLISSTIELRWGMNAASVGRILQIEQNLSVHDEITLKTQPKNMARRLLIYDALQSAELIFTKTDDQQQFAFSFAHVNNRTNSECKIHSIYTELLKIVLNFHLSPHLVTSLLSNQSVSVVMRKSGVRSRSHVYRLIETCPRGLLEAIDSSFNSQSDNWARSALKRRKS